MKREDKTGAGNGIALKWTKQRKEERGKDETGGQNESRQWYCPEMDETGKGRSREWINQTDEATSRKGNGRKKIYDK